MSMRAPEELARLLEAYLDDLSLTPELSALAEPMRYTLGSGGKRIRPVLCLATGEAAGCEPEALLPAAAAVELVHTFSLVHDDLPALDDDDLRRGRASAHVAFGEAVAILTGDALLAEAFRLALSLSAPGVGRELAAATLGMIGGQYLDVTAGNGDLATLHRLKTGSLFAASVGCALWVAGVPEEAHGPWRAFGGEVGLLFQIVDDVLDGDGYVLTLGERGARDLAEETERRAQALLAGLPADTAVLSHLAASLAARTS